jgi:hypothetical protein
MCLGFNSIETVLFYKASDPRMIITIENQFFRASENQELSLEAEGAALEAELDAGLFAPQHDTVGFARRYQRSSNPFADGFARTSGHDPSSAFNPVNKHDPDNPLNSMNRYNRNNPFNPMNEADPRNPANGFNRGV